MKNDDAFWYLTHLGFSIGKGVSMARIDSSSSSADKTRSGPAYRQSAWASERTRNIIEAKRIRNDRTTNNESNSINSLGKIRKYYHSSCILYGTVYAVAVCSVYNNDGLEHTLLCICWLSDAHTWIFASLYLYLPNITLMCALSKHQTHRPGNMAN